jgi:signal transduction histidine kinase
VLAVQVPAAFHETPWFKVLVIALVVALLWLMHRLVLRQQAARLVLELRARAHERERIARDLHDTLLQAMQGLILRLHSLTARDVSKEAMRQYVAGVLDDAEELLEQGRDQVQQMASDGAATEGLQRALIQTAERFIDKQVTRFECKQSGNPWDLPPRVHREALAIGREAVINACKHARAARICVEIEYGASDITINVSDDGQGIANPILEQGGKRGHFGLQSMRQRAAEIRARLNISSTHTSGTCISLTVSRHAV